MLRGSGPTPPSPHLCPLLLHSWTVPTPALPLGDSLGSPRPRQQVRAEQHSWDSMFPTEWTLSAGLPATLAGDSHPALLMLRGWSIWSPRPLSFFGSLPLSFWVLMSLSLPSSFHSQAGMVCLEAPEWWKLWLRAPGLVHC